MFMALGIPAMNTGWVSFTRSIITKIENLANLTRSNEFQISAY